MLIYADSIVVPVETSYLSSSAIEEMFEYVSELREDLSKIKLIIPNKYRKVVKKHNEHLEAIRNIFLDTGTKVLNPIPIRSEIEKAGEEGLSIFEIKSDLQEMFGEILKEAANENVKISPNETKSEVSSEPAEEAPSLKDVIKLSLS